MGVKSLFYYLFFKSIFIFNFISYVKFLIIKISKKKNNEFLSFFENYENNNQKHKNQQKKKMYPYKFFQLV